MKKLKISAAASLIFAAMFLVTSCQKEELQNPANNQDNKFKAVMLSKTNGGKQAPSVNFTNPSFSEGQNKAAPKVFNPNASMFGNSYSTWTAEWWKWAMELAPVANHPFNDDPGFDVTMGQSGNVWMLGTPFGTVTRTCTIPEDKSLLIGMINAEASDLEGLGSTYAERLGTANWFADHIVPSSLSCTVDGVPVNVSAYRFVSPEFTFTAPTPWIYGATGGNGTSVADGYFVMVRPLDSGNHTIHYTGAYHFTLAEDGFDFDASADVTYNVTVQ
jgi:hypothetical protein